MAIWGVCGAFRGLDAGFLLLLLPLLWSVFCLLIVCLFVVCCFLFVVFLFVFFVCCLLVVVYCYLSAVCCPLFVDRRWLSVGCRLSKRMNEVNESVNIVLILIRVYFIRSV